MKGTLIMKQENHFNIVENMQLTENEKSIIDVNNDISNIIIKLVNKRKELNISQRELAFISKIKQPMIARIERLSVIPRIDTLIILARSLNLTLDVITIKENNSLSNVVAIRNKVIVNK